MLFSVHHLFLRNCKTPAVEAWLASAVCYEDGDHVYLSEKSKVNKCKKVLNKQPMDCHIQLASMCLFTLTSFCRRF